MSTSRTVVAILASAIALLGCGMGKGGAPGANSPGAAPAGAVQGKAASWTLGGVPCCTLIPVPAAATPVWSASPV